MDVLQIPLMLGLGAIALVLLGLGYEMASAWWMAKERARRWGE